jgi:hypothetical protein
MSMHRAHGPLFVDKRTLVQSLPSLRDLREPEKREPGATSRPAIRRRWWFRWLGIGTTRPIVVSDVTTRLRLAQQERPRE